MNYWKEFYKKPHISTPTDFAKFVIKRLPKGTLIDVGSGNGRDTKFFKKNGFDAVGYDTAFDKTIPNFSAYDIVYSRFFLHVIPTKKVRKLISQTKGYFVAEARIVGDEPVLYKNHKRYFVRSQWLLNYLSIMGFRITYFEEGRGLAKYKNEDPLVMRVIAKRK